MKKFLLLFRNASADNGYLTTTQDTADDVPRWQSWIGNIAMQGKLVTTAPIEYHSKVVNISDVHDGPHKENYAVLISGS